MRALILFLFCVGSGHFDDMDTRFRSLTNEKQQKGMWAIQWFEVKSLTWSGKNLCDLWCVPLGTHTNNNWEAAWIIPWYSELWSVIMKAWRREKTTGRCKSGAVRTLNCRCPLVGNKEEMLHGSSHDSLSCEVWSWRREDVKTTCKCILHTKLLHL